MSQSSIFREMIQQEDETFNAMLENNYDYVVNGKQTTRRNFAEDFK